MVVQVMLVMLVIGGVWCVVVVAVVCTLSQASSLLTAIFDSLLATGLVCLSFCTGHNPKGVGPNPAGPCQ